MAKVTGLEYLNNRFVNLSPEEQNVKLKKWQDIYKDKARICIYDTGFPNVTRVSDILNPYLESGLLNKINVENYAQSEFDPYTYHGFLMTMILLPSLSKYSKYLTIDYFDDRIKIGQNEEDFIIIEYNNTKYKIPKKSYEIGLALSKCDIVVTAVAAIGFNVQLGFAKNNTGNTMIIASAGNNGLKNPTFDLDFKDIDLELIASYDMKNEIIANYTSGKGIINLSAPGNDIPTIDLQNEKFNISGTSPAAYVFLSLVAAISINNSQSLKETIGKLKHSENVVKYGDNKITVLNYVTLLKLLGNIVNTYNIYIPITIKKR